MIKAGIFGATGYAGIELVHILERHPNVEIAFATTRSYVGQTLDAVFPQAPAVPLIDGEDAPLDEVEAVFLCLPHAASAATAVRAREHGCRVIDLSADFRLNDVDLYEQWYGVTHPRPDWLRTAVYGLTEHVRGHLPPADLVACPGCYPTSILLPLHPLATAGAIGGPVIADAKSGVSGGGRKANLLYHFVEASDNMTPYKQGQSHRHWAEMQEKLTLWAPEDDPAPRLIFSPHLMAIPRGILSTIYVPLADGWDEAHVRKLFDVYADEPFVRVLPAGQAATIAHVVRTNKCVIGLQLTADNMLLITSAIDNLIKGSSGQAVQNFNLMFGLPETAGLV